MPFFHFLIVLHAAYKGNSMYYYFPVLGKILQAYEKATYDVFQHILGFHVPLKQPLLINITNILLFPYKPEHIVAVGTKIFIGLFTE